MPRPNRSTTIPAGQVGIYHCYDRCVQQMTLCGIDPLDGTDRSDRKTWMAEMLDEMSCGFAIEILTYCFMSNHYHILLRPRPDLAACYSKLEVTKRWWLLCPGQRDEDFRPFEPDIKDLNPWLSDSEYVAELRNRLSSVSWFMQLYNARTARRCNAESGRKGHFYEGRFGARALLDEAGLLACALYVDLNKVRANLAATPEQSVFTSGNDRIASHYERLLKAKRLGCSEETIKLLHGMGLDILAADPRSPDAFLAPVALEAEKQLKRHLEMNFPESGAIAWQTMDQLRRNAPLSSDRTLLELNRLLSLGDRGYRQSIIKSHNVESIAAAVNSAPSITSASKESDGDPSSRDASQDAIQPEMPAGLVLRPRPWNARRSRLEQLRDLPDNVTSQATMVEPTTFEAIVGVAGNATIGEQAADGAGPVEVTASAATASGDVSDSLKHEAGSDLAAFYAFDEPNGPGDLSTEGDVAETPIAEKQLEFAGNKRSSDIESGSCVAKSLDSLATETVTEGPIGQLEVASYESPATKTDKPLVTVNTGADTTTETDTPRTVAKGSLTIDAIGSSEMDGSGSSSSSAEVPVDSIQRVSTNGVEPLLEKGNTSGTTISAAQDPAVLPDGTKTSGQRKRVPLSSLLKRTKRRKTSGGTTSGGTNVHPRKRAGGVHWLDRLGDRGLRSDPDDRSGRLPFPSTRASNKGFLSMTLLEYLELLDWTGRRLVPDKSGAIPKDAPPILERLGLKAEGFIETIRTMGNVRRVAIGSAEAMAAEAQRVHRRWLQNSHSMDDAFHKRDERG